MTGPNVGQFGEYEQVEETKFYPTPDLEPAPLERGELPSTYGKNRLVLLPVDPYLMYTYWELAADAPPTAGSRAVLRFHESPVGVEGSRPFDVDIDLAAGNWYVHLWSPEKTYQADLGLRGEDGSFVALAHSNTVRTPPALPVPQPLPCAPATLDVEAEVAVLPEPEPELVQAPEPLHVQKPTDKRPPAPSRVDAAARLQQRLEELFAIRGELPPLPEPYLYAASDFGLTEMIEGVSLDDAFEDLPPFHLADLRRMDLTQYSEERFSPGVSSEGGRLGD